MNNAAGVERASVEVVDLTGLEDSAEGSNDFDCDDDVVLVETPQPRSVQGENDPKPPAQQQPSPPDVGGDVGGDEKRAEWELRWAAAMAVEKHLAALQRTPNAEATSFKGKTLERQQHNDPEPQQAAAVAARRGERGTKSCTTAKRKRT